MVGKRLAVIPARGGSKRIPGKNVIDFGGRPMIQWTIEAALETGAFEHVLVFTDDEKIAEISRTAGAEVPFLREAFTDDHSPVSMATCVALERAEAHWGIRYHSVVQLMANCPLRSATEIDLAIRSFDSDDRRFQISACRFGWMNPWWAARLSEVNRPEFLFPQARLERSQDLPTLLFPTGAAWLAERDALLESRDFYGPDFKLAEMPWTTGVDIDDWGDLEFAVAVAEMIKRRNLPNGRARP